MLMGESEILSSFKVRDFSSSLRKSYFPGLPVAYMRMTKPLVSPGRSRLLALLEEGADQARRLIS